MRGKEGGKRDNVGKWEGENYKVREGNGRDLQSEGKRSTSGRREGGKEVHREEEGKGEKEVHRQEEGKGEIGTK